MARETTESGGELIAIRLPVWWTFGGLVAGLLLGWVLAESSVITALLAITEPTGALWLRALQMTIIPLVAALLVVGIAQMVRAARAGRVARRMLMLVFAVLVFSGTSTAVLMPLRLDTFPIPAAAASLLETETITPQQVPGIADFVTSLVAPNVVAAAAETAMLPLTIFFAVFAVAVARLPEGQRATLLGFFRAMANAMLTIIGWVLWLAPVGVFALAVGVAAKAGGGAFATLVHYILTVTAMGTVIMLAGYVLAIVLGRMNPLAFARAMIPAQAVALSTQSSLASLPAMLATARRLGVRESTADFALPLSVAIFRATSPAMNMAVAIYVATLAGVELSPMILLAGIAVALGVPVEPLALLVAVEMLPDIMRTLGNVTMDVAVTTAVDRTRDDTHMAGNPSPADVLASRDTNPATASPGENQWPSN